MDHTDIYSIEIKYVARSVTSHMPKGPLQLWFILELVLVDLSIGCHVLGPLTTAWHCPDTALHHCSIFAALPRDCLFLLRASMLSCIRFCSLGCYRKQEC